MSASLPSVFVIGSSATLLMDPYLEQMLRGVWLYSRKGRERSGVQEALRNLDTPQGASAGDSSMVLEYLGGLDRSGTFHPDIVLLHVGMHDLKRALQTGRARVPLDRYQVNVEKIVAWFLQRSIRLVWMRAGPLDETLHNERCKGFRRSEADLRDYNEAAEAILQRHGIPVLDLAGFTARLGPMDRILKDHVHFTDEVVRLQAAFVAGYLSGLSLHGDARAALPGNAGFGTVRT